MLLDLSGEMTSPNPPISSSKDGMVTGVIGRFGATVLGGAGVGGMVVVVVVVVVAEKEDEDEGGRLNMDSDARLELWLDWV